MDRVETVILSNLIFNEEYSRKILPFLKEEYFSSREDALAFSIISSYIMKYNTLPNKEALLINLEEHSTDEMGYKRTKENIEQLSFENSKLEWLLDTSEKFCQEKAVHNALRESIKILENKDGKVAKGSIPQILSDALAVSFDTHIGHDFIDDAENRFDFYTKKEERVKFLDLEYFNLVTNGGFPKKTLNILLASTGVGKSLAMCHMAAANLMDGKNVLYITLELAEERVSERIDANLLNTPMSEIASMSRDSYLKKIERIKSKTAGKLIVKEYPTAQGSSANFRYLINELRLKKKFVPDIVYIDYLNICASARIKPGMNASSYTYVKAIAEELRGLGVEFNLPIVSATQTTRGGANNSEIEMTDTSECIYLEELIQMKDGKYKKIKEVEVADQIKSNDGFKTVIQKHHSKLKECVRITLEDGKKIIVSKDHIFPTIRGRASINTGLVVGDKLKTT